MTDAHGRPPAVQFRRRCWPGAKLQHLQHRVSTADYFYTAITNSALFAPLHEKQNKQQCRKTTSSPRQHTYLRRQPSLSRKRHRSYFHIHPHPHYPGRYRSSSRARPPNHGPSTRTCSTPRCAPATKPPRGPSSSASKRALASTTSASSRSGASSMKRLRNRTRIWRRCLRGTRRY